MIEQEKTEKIKKLIEEVLRKMSFDNFEIKITNAGESDEKGLYINIETSESNLLIGQHGVTLKALQHILRVIIRRRTEEKINFLVDVNNYLRQKTSTVIEMAHEAAKRAQVERKPIVLRPMSAYERRLVHLELSENENVKTESIGEGEDRKVVVRPVGDLEKLEAENN